MCDHVCTSKANTYNSTRGDESERARNRALVPTCLGIPEDLYKSRESETQKHVQQTG